MIVYIIINFIMKYINNNVDNFHKVSVYCFYHGYMGGENLLRYDETCNINTGPILTYSMKIGIKKIINIQ